MWEVGVGEIIKMSESPVEEVRLLFWLIAPCVATPLDTATANLRTKILDFRGFDSSIISI